jgi:hypothetical protein
MYSTWGEDSNPEYQDECGDGLPVGDLPYVDGNTEYCTGSCGGCILGPSNVGYVSVNLNGERPTVSAFGRPPLRWPTLANCWPSRTSGLAGRATPHLRWYSRA